MSSAIRKAGAITATAVAVGAAIVVGGSELASAGSATATTGVNIRSGPGTKYAVVGGLVRGQSITTVGKISNGWVKVRFNGGTAYVSATYLATGGKAVSTAPVTIYTKGSKIASAPLNVRQTASLSAKVIGYIPAGQHVTLTGKQSRGYAEVLYGGRRAWVTAQYLISGVAGLPPTSNRVATADLLVRTTADPDFKIVTTVRKGSTLKVTGATRNGYAQIVYNNSIRWVTARYLSTKAVTGPVSTKPSTTKPSGSKPSTSEPVTTKPALPKVVGTRYATTELLVRTTAGSDYKTVATVQRGQSVKITGTTKSGRAQIIYGGAVRWVTALYLSTTKPSTAPATSGSSGSSGTSGSGTSTGSSGAAGTGGVDPNWTGKSKNVADSIWDDLAMCEASGNWSINTGNGYYGGLQFALSTWREFGGLGMPNKATRLDQIKIAERVLAGQGWGAWPACTKKLGLR